VPGVPKSDQQQKEGRDQMSNRMTKHEGEQLAARVNAMHSQLGAAMESISQCLATMALLADPEERVAEANLFSACLETLHSPIADEVEQLQATNLPGFVAMFAALDLAYSSFNAYADVFNRVLDSALANKNDHSSRRRRSQRAQDTRTS
jgi:hypothetical protein